MPTNTFETAEEQAVWTAKASPTAFTFETDPSNKTGKWMDLVAQAAGGGGLTYSIASANNDTYSGQANGVFTAAVDLHFRTEVYWSDFTYLFGGIYINLDSDAPSHPYDNSGTYPATNTPNGIFALIGLDERAGWNGDSRVSGAIVAQLFTDQGLVENEMGIFLHDLSIPAFINLIDFNVSLSVEGSDVSATFTHGLRTNEIPPHTVIDWCSAGSGPCTAGEVTLTNTTGLGSGDVGLFTARGTRGSINETFYDNFAVTDDSAVPPLRQNLRLGMSDVLSNASVSKIQASESFFDRVLDDDPFSMYNVHLQKLGEFWQRKLATDDDNKNYDYENILDRMARAYPPTHFKQAGDIVSAAATITPHQYIDDLLETWKTNDEFSDWFDYEACPPIYPFILNPSTGIYDQDIYEAQFGFLQDEDNPDSMLDIMKKMIGNRGFFPGYTMYATADNKFAIRAAHWADSYSDGTTALTLADFRTFPYFPPRDTAGLANIIEVSSRGYEFASNQPLAGDSYLPYYIDPSAPSSPPAGRTEITSSSLSLDEAIWQTMTVTYDIRAYDGSSSSEEFSVTGTLTLTEGQSYGLLVGGNTITGGILLWNQSVEAVLNFWVPNGKETLEVAFIPSKTDTSVNSGATINWIALIDVAGDVYQLDADTTSVIVDETQNTVDGLVESQARYGKRKARFENNFWNFSLENLTLIAEGLASYLINPRRYYRLALTPSAASGYKMLPENIGQAYTLPTGATAVLSDYAYNADYTSQAPSEITQVELTVVSDPSGDESGDGGVFPGPTASGGQSGTTYRRAIYRGGP